MNVLRAILKRLGIDAFQRRSGYHYVPNYYGPAASKSMDIRTLPGFGPLATEVIAHGRTLLYFDRLYTHYQLLQYVSQLPDVARSSMAEVGVYKGGGSFFIASVLASLGLEAVILNSFDTFEGHVSSDINKEDPYQKAHVFNDTSFEGVTEYLSRFSNVKTIKGRIQDTSPSVDGQIFSFVHLDMDLYEPTLFALKFFDSRLISGGAVLIDDYGFLTCPGVKQAVDEFLNSNTRYFGMYLLTGQYFMIRR